MKGIVVDNQHAELVGLWKSSRSFGGFIEQGYLHDGDEAKGDCSVIFRPMIDRVGRYEVRLYFIAHSNRASNVPVTIRSADGEKKVSVNQKKSANKEGFVTLGTFRFEKGSQGTITISNADTNGHVIADAVQLIRVK